MSYLFLPGVTLETEEKTLLTSQRILAFSPLWSAWLSIWRVRFNNPRLIQQNLKTPLEGGNRTGSILKAGLQLKLDCGLWVICPISMETTYQLESQAPRRKSPRALCCLKEYPNYLCNRIELYILLCLLGYDHSPIDNCPLWLLGYDHSSIDKCPLLTRLKANESPVNFVCFFSFVQTSFRKFGEVRLGTYT